MKLLIAGSRSIKDFDLSPYIPKDTELIISGGASGVDTLAEQYADKMKISKLVLYPNYNRFVLPILNLQNRRSRIAQQNDMSYTMPF